MWKFNDLSRQLLADDLISGPEEFLKPEALQEEEICLAHDKATQLTFAVLLDP